MRATMGWNTRKRRTGGKISLGRDQLETPYSAVSFDRCESSLACCPNTLASEAGAKQENKEHREKMSRDEPINVPETFATFRSPWTSSIDFTRLSKGPWQTTTTRDFHRDPFTNFLHEQPSSSPPHLSFRKAARVLSLARPYTRASTNF